MPAALKFVEAVPGAAAERLDAGSIHLWRLPYAPSHGRAPLLQLLGAYLGKPAHEVRLSTDPRGKPGLPHHGGGPRIEFNWSHSGDQALVALSRDPALGVDIERRGRKVRALELARRFFDPLETEALSALAGPARGDAFLGLWCSKEAVLKAAGEGLSFGLARLVFEWQGGMAWKLARVDPALGDRDEWQLASFEAAPGYRGSLAWRGPVQRIGAFHPCAAAA